MASTLLGSVTSALKKKASLHSAAVFSPASTPTSATHTLAPSSENRSAASRPMPPAAPVITATLPSSRPTLRLGRDVEVLELRVPVERVHAELPAEAGLLEPAERRRNPDGRIRIDGEDAGLERPSHPQGARPVLCPDRSRKPVRRVVRNPDGIGLVLESDHGGDRAEHLLARDAILVRRLNDRTREPEAAALGCVSTVDNSTVEVGRHPLALLGGDQRPHLGGVVLWVADPQCLRRVDEQLQESLIDRA